MSGGGDWCADCKMAAGYMSTKEITSNFNVNSYVSTNSECQCCSYLRSEVCYLVNELKSVTEIINMLQEEAKYDRTVKHDQRTYSDCIKKTYSDLFTT